jgi:hypothetical protein
MVKSVSPVSVTAVYGESVTVDSGEFLNVCVCVSSVFAPAAKLVHCSTCYFQAIEVLMML